MEKFRFFILIVILVYVVSGDVVVNNIVYFKNYAYIYGSSFDSIDSIFLGSANVPASDYTVFNSTVLKLNFTYDPSVQTIIVGSASKTVWNPWVIDSVSELPTEGGQITIRGSYLNNEISRKNYIQINGSQNIFNIIDGTNETNINIFTVPSSITDNLAGSNIPLSAVIRGSRYDTTWAFTPLTISSIIKGSNSITINGDSLGGNQSFLHCQIDGYDLSITNFVKHKQIQLDTTKLPAGFFNIAGNKNVKVQLKDYTAYGIITIRPILKTITSVSSDTGGLVTITGDLLSKIRINGVPTIRSVTVGQSICESLTPLSQEASSNAFTCIVPPITSPKQQMINIPVNISIDEAYASSSLFFNYDVPYISDISQHGNFISVKGVRLGSAMSNDTKFIIDKYGIYTPKSISFTNGTEFDQDTKIDGRQWELEIAIDQKLLGGEYSGKITTHGNYLESNNFTFSIRPDIGEITFPPTSGGLITINGALFRNPISITFGQNITCANATLVNSNAITCNIPSGSGKNLTVNVSINNVKLISEISYQPPKIYNTTTLTRSGGILTIYGENFSSKNLQVSINGSSCSAEPYCIDDKTISCPLTTDAMSSFNEGKLGVYVSVDGQSDLKYTFSVEAIYGHPSMNYLPIILPIGIVLVLFIIVTTVILTYVKIKKYRQLKAVMKFINSD